MDYVNNKYFEFKLFRKLQKSYFKNTPDSDSLYRRRNKLILFGFSIIGYSITHSWVDEYRILFSNRKMKIISIPLIKFTICFIWIASFQLILKYIYYLNKIFKSYQFGLEGILKYRIIKSDDYTYNQIFDIIDGYSINKNS